MENELVSFETAKLAKEKGFNINTQFYWQVNEKIGLKKRITGLPNYYADGCITIEQPTQSLLQRWLREEHEIIVIPTIFNKGWLEDNKFCYQYHLYDKTDQEGFVSIKEYKTWEEALEAGLTEALNLISK